MHAGSGEELDCGTHWRHGEPVNVSTIKDTMAAAKAANMTVLSYFNFMYFGENPIWPLQRGGLPPVVAQDEFMNSSLYLARYLNDSVCVPFRRDWQGSVGMDPQGPSWRAFLSSQIEAKVKALGADFNGIVVDEPTAAADFSTARDDGISWCGAGASSSPCASQLVAWQRTARSIRAALSPLNEPGGPRQRVMLTNQIDVLRIDLMEEMDGVFTEQDAFTAAGHDQTVNAVGLLGMGVSPIIVWMVEACFTEASPDLIMQKQLLMGTMPMAPAFGNDHSVSPGIPAIDDIHVEYGRLFAVMRGTQWFLNVSEPVKLGSLPSAIATANVFTKDSDELIVVVMSATERDGSTVELGLAHAIPLCGGAAASCVCESLQPAKPPQSPLHGARGVGGRSAVQCTRDATSWKCNAKTLRGGFIMMICPLLSFAAAPLAGLRTDDEQAWAASPGDGKRDGNTIPPENAWKRPAAGQHMDWSAVYVGPASAESELQQFLDRGWLEYELQLLQVPSIMLLLATAIVCGGHACWPRLQPLRAVRERLKGHYTVYMATMYAAVAPWFRNGFSWSLTVLNPPEPFQKLRFYHELQYEICLADSPFTTGLVGDPSHGPAALDPKAPWAGWWRFDRYVAEHCVAPEEPKTWTDTIVLGAVLLVVVGLLLLLLVLIVLCPLFVVRDIFRTIRRLVAGHGPPAPGAWHLPPWIPNAWREDEKDDEWLRDLVEWCDEPDLRGWVDRGVGQKVGDGPIPFGLVFETGEGSDEG
jgi:hypothetical protein